jgi:Mycoplasma protein of unknown function, DUF285
VLLTLALSAFSDTFYNSSAGFQPMIDVWDTSAVTDMVGMVRYNICTYTWILRSHQLISFPFYPTCGKFIFSDFNSGSLNGWNVGKVTAMDNMVSSCRRKDSYDVAGELEDSLSFS